METGSLSTTSCTTERSRKKLSPKSKRRKLPIIRMNRSWAGLSKPNCRSISLMNSGSMPRAPRYRPAVLLPASRDCCCAEVPASR